MFNQTSFIVLKKEPYQDAHLLLYGISPDFGRMSLLVYNGRKADKNHFPQADLFQEFDVAFEKKDNSDLFTVKELDLRTDFSTIAENLLNFKFAGKIAQFLLAHTESDLPFPFTYDAARNVFLQLILPPDTPGRWSLEESAASFKLCYLYEAGLLPEFEGKVAELIESIISAVIEGAVLPAQSESYYKKLNEYCNSLLEYHNISR